MHDAALRDIEDRQRHDDPSTTNTGIGWDLFVESTPGGSAYDDAIGTAVPYRTTSGATPIAFQPGFSFTFYGRTYTSVQASVNGFLQFGGLDSANGGDSNTLDEFLRNVRIAPLWDNLRTDQNQSAASGSTQGNIFVDKTQTDRITIRWAATRQDTGGGDVNFSVTLFANGNIRFDYGDGNQSLTPTIGLSAGNGYTFVTSAYNGQANLNNAASVLFTPTPGLTYFDIGAYEFLGDSGDDVPPQVTAVGTLPPDNGTTALAFSSIQISMSEALNSISAKSPANYDLREAGVDNQFDTNDDVIVTIRPAYSYPETSLTLDILTGLNATPGILPDGEYRLTLKADPNQAAIYDLSGNPLDGNGDGTGGDPYIRHFNIDRSSNLAPVANDQSVNLTEDGSVVITLSASDGNGDVLTYTLLGDPPNGTLSEFNPAARTVRYTPDAGYTGPDSFQFRVDDGKAGVDDGTITLNVQPINDAPVANNQSISLDEDTPRLIVLDATDTETARPNLVFTLVTGPLFGTLTQGAAGGWTYTPNANYTGPDSFTWTVRDRGDPDGSGANAITSAPMTVSLTVNPVNDAPVIAAVGDQVVLEGSTLLVDLDATDTEAQAVTWSLDAAPAGMSINASTGVITWTPSDGFGVVSVTARATDAGTPAAFATISFDVTVQNVAPTLVLSGAAEVDQGVLYTLNLGSTDPGSDTIVSWEINWGDGSIEPIVGNPASVTHTFFAGGSSYGITATATDEDGTFSSNTWSVLVKAPNTAPVPQSQTVFLDEDTPTVITLNATDINGDPLTYSLESGPSMGTLSAIDPVTRQVTFTPNANVRGNDSFLFRVSDGLASAVGTITLKIRPVNDVPVANPATFDTPEDTPLAGTLTGTDVETPAELTFALVSGPASGTLTLNPDGTFTYDPVANFNGTVSFRFTVTDTGDDELDCGCPLEPSGFTPDGPDTSAFATVIINVLSVNDPPVATDDGYGTTAGQSLVVATALGVLANDTDVEGNVLVVDSVVDNVDNGTLTLQADGGFTYIPNAGFSGTDQFTYRVTDGNSGFDDGVVTITVAPQQNGAPVALDDAIAVHGPTQIPAATLLANDSDPNGDSFSITGFSGASNGTVGYDGTNFTYTPNAGFTGTDAFTYTIADNLGASDVATVNLTVANGAPNAADDPIAVHGVTVIAVATLLGNDSDPDGDPFSITGFSGASNGTVGYDGTNFTYTPNAGFTGTDAFTYTIADNLGASDVATVNLTVANGAPDAVDDPVAVHGATVIAVATLLGNDSDPDGDPFSITGFSGASNGTVGYDGTNFTYTPNAGFTGTDAFTYTIADNLGASDVATVNLTVANGAPDAADDTVTRDPILAITISAAQLLANDSDPDGDAFSITGFSGASNGAVGYDGTNFTYTPNAGFTGADAFTYTITDSLGRSDTATVTISVGNTPPVAQDDAYQVQEGRTLTVAAPVGLLANDSDADAGDTVTAFQFFQPANGTVNLVQDGSFTYTPNAGFAGTDTFNYSITDGIATSQATVTITVIEGNPTPGADSYTVLHDRVLTIAAPGLLGNDTDPNGDPVTAFQFFQPANGTVSLVQDGSFTYTPNAGFVGTDTFSYSVTDGTLTGSATVTINVINTQPVAQADSYSVQEGRTLSVAAAVGLLANDTDADAGDPVTAFQFFQPANGTVNLVQDGSFTYTPNAGFTGTDTFNYSITDGVLTGQGTVTINVTVSNTPPVAQDGSYNTRVGTTLTVTTPGFLANDTDADGDTIVATQITDGVDNGTLTAFPDGSFTYTPNAGFLGSDSFSYSVSDGHGGTDIATVTIAVTNINPDAVDDSYTTRANTALTITAPGFLANDTDADGDTIVATQITDNVDHGTLTAFPDGSFTYTPTTGFVGTDSFSYAVSDGFGGTDIATATISVTNINPDAVDDSYSTHAGQQLTIAAQGFLGNDTDADGDTIVATQITDNVDNGTLTAFPDGSFTYTPDAGFAGTDSFSYAVSDGFGGTDTATVTINVTNANPDAVDDTYATRANTALSIPAPGFLGNDTDADGDSVTATQITDNVDNGTLTAFPDGSFTYTPTTGFVGTDSFSYAVSDGHGGTDTATVTINVTNVNPNAVDDSYTTRANTALIITAPGFLGNDTDADSDTIVATQITDNVDHGTLTAFPDGSFTYTPTTGFVGTDSFSYAISDGFGGTGIATVTINVTNINPNAVDDGYATGVGQQLVIAAPGFLGNDTDADGDTIVATQITDNVDNGTLTAFPDGSFIYTPNSAFLGTDSFSYAVSDGHGGTDIATVTIQVVSTNTPPQIVPIANVGTSEGDLVTIDVNAIDVDGDDVTFELVAGPAGATIDPTSGIFQWTATDGDASYAVTVRATDVHGDSTDAIFTIDVTNVPPAIGLVGAPTAVLGEAYSLTFGAGDPGDDTVTQWEIDWGDGNVEILIAGSGPLTLQHIYTSGTGAFEINATATDEDGTWSAAQGLTIEVVPAQFRVTTFTPTASGFTVRFNQVVDPSVLNLYQGLGSDPARSGDADIRVVIGSSTTPVRGSLVMDEDGRGFAFVKTGGTLSAGTYNVTIASRANGLIDSLGRQLDGDANGTAGGDFTTSFVRGAAPATTPVLSLPDFIRGPGQDVRVPNNAAAGVALPLTLANADGVRRVTFTLNYDASLLDISAIEAMPGGPAATVTVAGVAGALQVTIEFAAPLSGSTARAVANIRATVPGTAPYGVQHRLDIADVQATSGGGATTAGIDDDAMHVVGYLGDADGNQSYGARDPFLLQNVLAGRDSGFGAWALTDPTIVGDSVPAAGLNVLDMLRLQQHVIALSTNPTGGMPEFPPIPTLSLLALSTAMPASSEAFAPSTESVGAKVNWSGSFAAGETAPSVAGTNAAVTGAATDWMNAPWARDLAERLTTTHEQSESSRGILPGRELLRTLTRAFARR